MTRPAVIREMSVHMRTTGRTTGASRIYSSTRLRISAVSGLPRRRQKLIQMDVISNIDASIVTAGRSLNITLTTIKCKNAICCLTVRKSTALIITVRVSAATIWINYMCNRATEDYPTWRGPLISTSVSSCVICMRTRTESTKFTGFVRIQKCCTPHKIYMGRDHSQRPLLTL